MNPFEPASARSPDHGPINLLATAALDRTLVHRHGGSVRYLVITVRAPDAPAAAPAQPLNLALVIDASGSMAGAPLAAAKAAALAVAEQLTAADRLSLVSFARDVRLHAAALRMDPAGKAEVRAVLEPLGTRGSTDLGAGWLAGCEAVAQRQATAPSARHHALVLSDGHANQGILDAGHLAAIAADLRQRGVLTSTVGIGDGYSPVQLQALAEAGGGRMHDAERPDELAAVILGELGAARATTVDNLEAWLELPPGVQARVYGTAPHGMAEGRFRVVLGAMQGGAERAVVVMLQFPAWSGQDRLRVPVVLRWQEPGGGAMREQVLPACEAEFAAADACRAQPRDSVLAAQVARQWHAHAMHTAMGMNQHGDEAGAQRYLEQELRWFERYCRGLPAAAQWLHSLRHLAATVLRRYAPRAAKEILLGSYKRSRGERDLRHGRGEAEDFIG